MRRAIIIAAGRGSRLENHTDERPKCMVEIAGRSIIDYQLDAFRSNGVTDLHIIRGPAGMGGMGRKDAGQVKPLWCLGAVEPIAVLCARHLLLEPGPERIADRKGRCRTRRCRQRIDDRVNDGGADAGTGDIMNQNMRHLISVQRLQPGTNRRGAFGTTCDDLMTCFFKSCGLFHIVGVQHNYDPVDARMDRKSPERVIDHPGAGNPLPLLWQVTTRTLAASGGDNDRGDCHGGRGALHTRLSMALTDPRQLP